MGRSPRKRNATDRVDCHNTVKEHNREHIYVATVTFPVLSKLFLLYASLHPPPLLPSSLSATCMNRLGRRRYQTCQLISSFLVPSSSLVLGHCSWRGGWGVKLLRLPKHDLNLEWSKRVSDQCRNECNGKLGKWIC